jgi:predicted Rossmann fold nucleotide-binding protein DprA/Smf involved in DNA uptake
MLNAAGEHAVANSISRNRYDQISDARMRSIVQWARTTNTPKTDPPGSLPFSPSEAPEIIGTAVFYHYINRMAAVLLGETPLHIDAIIRESELEPGKVSSLLLNLELKGLISQWPGKCFSKKM